MKQRKKLLDNDKNNLYLKTFIISLYKDAIIIKSRYSKTLKAFLCLKNNHLFSWIFSVKIRGYFDF